MVVGHVAPEAQVGGTIALIRDGDMVTVSTKKKELSVAVDDEELARRRGEWSPKETKYPRGALWKFGQLCSSASKGAVTS